MRKTIWQLPRIIILCGLTTGVLSILCVIGYAQNTASQGVMLSQETPLVVSLGLLVSISGLLIAIGGGLSLFRSLQAQVKEQGERIKGIEQAIGASAVKVAVLEALQQYGLSLAERKEV